MEGAGTSAAIRVLVVDDAPIARRVAGGLVENLGGAASYAENGREALEHIEKHPVDIVLTDLQMPEVDGLHLTREVTERYPGMPVVLMTAHGSEEVAAAALRAGAVNYVPKDNLRQDLGEALRAVMTAVRAAKESAQVRDLLVRSECEFELGLEPAAGEALLGHLVREITQLGTFDETEILGVQTALTEALRNAIDHGNLELDSALRESSDAEYMALGRKRMQQEPYRDRRVHVTSRVSADKATYVIRDDGKGFDTSQLPDPRDPENLVRASGRGVLMMRMFMDEVTFNDAGNEVTMVLEPEGD